MNSYKKRGFGQIKPVKTVAYIPPFSQRKLLVTEEIYGSHRKAQGN
jgi:hypothetical protein